MWLVMLVPAIGIGATFAYFATQQPVYRASMTLVAGERPREDLRSDPRQSFADADADESD